MTLTTKALADLINAQCSEGQPQCQFAQFEASCRTLFGFKLLTIFAWSRERNEVLRIHSSDPERYPLNTWKPMGVTEWGAKVLKAGETVLCQTDADLEWAYPDHAKLRDMDCIASMSAPILHDGRVIGSSTINDSAESYTHDQLRDFQALVQCLSPALIGQPDLV